MYLICKEEIIFLILKPCNTKKNMIAHLYKKFQNPI